MLKIYKYPFAIEPGVPINIQMPPYSEILDVQIQNGMPVFWSVVDPDHELRGGRNFIVYGTGHEISSKYRLKYVGTFQMHNGIFVFHLFEIIE